MNRGRRWLTLPSSAKQSSSRSAVPFVANQKPRVEKRSKQMLSRCKTFLWWLNSFWARQTHAHYSEDPTSFAFLGLAYIKGWKNTRQSCRCMLGCSLQKVLVPSIDTWISHKTLLTWCSGPLANDFNYSAVHETLITRQKSSTLLFLLSTSAIAFDSVQPTWEAAMPSLHQSDSSFGHTKPFTLIIADVTLSVRYHCLGKTHFDRHQRSRTSFHKKKIHSVNKTTQKKNFFLLSHSPSPLSAPKSQHSSRLSEWKEEGKIIKWKNK